MASSVLMAVSAPVTSLFYCLWWLSVVCSGVLVIAAVLHWQRTRHWCLLALAAGSFLTGLGAVSTLALANGWLAIASLNVISTLVRSLTWSAVFAQVVATVGGVGAIHWAFRQRRRSPSIGIDTDELQGTPSVF